MGDFKSSSSKPIHYVLENCKPAHLADLIELTPPVPESILAMGQALMIIMSLPQEWKDVQT